ncbi:hypothetical protein FOZ61_000500, partial [Perkinsus olseni]
STLQRLLRDYDSSLSEGARLPEATKQQMILDRLVANAPGPARSVLRKKKPKTAAEVCAIFEDYKDKHVEANTNDARPAAGVGYSAGDRPPETERTAELQKKQLEVQQTMAAALQRLVTPGEQRPEQQEAQGTAPGATVSPATMMALMQQLLDRVGAPRGGGMPGKGKGKGGRAPRLRKCPLCTGGHPIYLCPKKKFQEGCFNCGAADHFAAHVRLSMLYHFGLSAVELTGPFRIMVDTGCCSTLIRRSVLPVGTEIRPVEDPGLFTVERGSCHVVGAVKLKVKIYASAQGDQKGAASSSGPSRYIFGLTALISDKLAYPLILGNEFLNHYRLDILYSSDPVRIVGPEIRPDPSSIPWEKDWDVISTAQDGAARCEEILLACHRLSAPAHALVSGDETKEGMTTALLPESSARPRLIDVSIQVCDSDFCADEAVQTVLAEEGPGLAPVKSLVKDSSMTEVKSVQAEEAPDVEPICLVGKEEPRSSEEELGEGCWDWDQDSFDHMLPSNCLLAALVQPRQPLLTDEELKAQGLLPPPSRKGQLPRSGKPPASQLVTGEEWPPAGFDSDVLQDDDIAGALRFAVPEFNSEEVEVPKLPEGDKGYKDLFDEYKDLFKKKPGECNLISHHVATGDHRPISEPMRPVPHKWREEVTDLLAEMEEMGVIRRSTSPWRFACVFVPKKNGKVRMCVDYRPLNAACHTEAYPVPRPDDVQEHLAHAKVFSTLDLRSGYWQLPVEKADQAKTAFCPGPGFPLYEWLRMPFGLASAPATFQRLMDQVLGHLPFVKIYLDDILIFSRDRDEHIRHLREVFRCLKEANLTVAGDKCEIGMSEVVYLGHLFSRDGMKPDPSKVDIILRWPKPETAAELRSFLGLAGYYRGFMPHFSEKARPLFEAGRACSKLKGGKLIDFWGDLQDQAFLVLKVGLASLPSLSYPDFDVPFTLCTDASDYAIGAVLEQRDRPVAFFSQRLTGSQLNWPVYEKEAYAIFQALERFRHYHIGHPLEVVVLSDHRPLQWLKKASTPKLQRWLLATAQYKFTVKYRQGRENVVADALSRVRMPEEPPKPTREVQGLSQEGIDEKLDLGACALLRQDETIKAVTDRKLDPSPLGRGELQSPELRPYRRLWAMLDVMDGLLVRLACYKPEEKPCWVPVIAPPLRAQLLEEYHAPGPHRGTEKTLEALRGYAFWPGMAEDVATYPPLPVGTPWHTVAVDFLSVAPSGDGISKLLVLVDHFTKYADAYPVRSESAEEAAAILVNLFSIMGMPARLLSDQGPAFESRLFSEVLRLLGVKKCRVSVYHPCANGHVERFNSTVLGLLRTYAATIGGSI